MKTYFSLPVMAIVCFFSSLAYGQPNAHYVAAKAGLSIREQPGPTAKVLDKIPYGTKITLLKNDEEWVPIVTENLNGYWRKVKYNNKTGYIIDSYLFPYPPPKATVKNMKEYFAQITVPFGAKLVVRSGSADMDEGAGELQKQLYKNGAEWHRFMGYEYGSNTYFIPDFSIQQAFLLLRLIPEFKDVFEANAAFPLEDKTYKKGDREYAVKVDKENFGEGYPWVKKISVEYEGGAIYNLEIYTIDNQVVILFGSGV